MVLKVFTDGGSKGNPGPAAIGYVGYVDGKELFRGREDIGIATNNDAEYTAVIRALQKAKELFTTGPALAPPNRARHLRAVGIPPLGHPSQNVKNIQFCSDSRLLVNQVNGLFKVKKGKIKEYILAIRTLEQEIGLPISYINIPREENTAADDLVNNKLGS